MKKLIRTLFVCFCMVGCANFTGWSQTIRLALIKVTHLNPKEVDDDDFTIGHRLPSAPIMAVVDFDSNEISIPQTVEEIESYEIWDENQSTLLYSGVDECDFVQALANLSGQPIMISLNTASYSLISYPNI